MRTTLSISLLAALLSGSAYGFGATLPRAHALRVPSSSIAKSGVTSSLAMSAVAEDVEAKKKSEEEVSPLSTQEAMNPRDMFGDCQDTLDAAL